MKRKPAAPVFKPYVMNQAALVVNHSLSTPNRNVLLDLGAVQVPAIGISSSGARVVIIGETRVSDVGYLYQSNHSSRRQYGYCSRTSAGQ